MIRGITNSNIRYLPLLIQAQSFQTIRLFSATNAKLMDDYEKKIYDKLQGELSPLKLDVRDVSGGCGSMFAIMIESDKFKGLPMIKQHRLVNEILKDDIAKWHGLQLRTKAT